MCMFIDMRNINLTHHSSFGKKFFIGQSKLCPMTEFSGATDEIDFDGNTLLLDVEILNSYRFPDFRFFNTRRMIKL